MSADTLSDVLRAVRLKGAVYFYVSGGKQWAAESPAAKHIASAIMPGAEHLMEYHVVTQGACWAGIVGASPVRLEEGDVVLFPQGDSHVLSSAPGMRAELGNASLYVTKVDHMPIRLTFEGTHGPRPSGEGERGLTTVICGFISCDVTPFNPLIDALPKMMVLKATDAGAWTAKVLQQAVAESHAGHPGSEAMLARISEMLFVDAVRRHVESLPADGTGWLAGLGDRYVGRALGLLHERPDHGWTIDELGHSVGLSRSALHERFVQFIGLPPMQYLARWRMQIACGLLRSTNATVATIALEVGYESEAAFARAFRRQIGAPPAAWKRSLTQANKRAALPRKAPSAAH